MRRKGAVIEYARERNREIFLLFREINSRGGLSRSEVCKIIAKSPASRFWVSEERASYVVSAMLAGRPLQRMRAGREAMFREILRRVRVLMEEHPDARIIELATTVIHQPAPEFYLTPGTVGIFYHYHCKSQRARSRINFADV